MASRCSGPVHRIAWPQICSFANHTNGMKSWPLFGASSAAIRWREPREIIIMLQIRTLTIGFVELLDCRLSTRPPKGHRSFCSLEESSAFIPSTRLSKMTCPVACSRSESGRFLSPRSTSEPLSRRLKEVK